MAGENTRITTSTTHHALLPRLTIGIFILLITIGSALAADFYEDFETGNAFTITQGAGGISRPGTSLLQGTYSLQFDMTGGSSSQYLAYNNTVFDKDNIVTLSYWMEITASPGNEESGIVLTNETTASFINSGCTDCIGIGYYSSRIRTAQGTILLNPTVGSEYYAEAIIYPSGTVTYNLYNETLDMIATANESYSNYGERLTVWAVDFFSDWSGVFNYDNINLTSTAATTPPESTDITDCRYLNIQNGNYTLTQDLINKTGVFAVGCLIMNATGINIDCQGHTIDGTSTTDYYGIRTLTDATVRNCVFTDWGTNNVGSAGINILSNFYNPINRNNLIENNTFVSGFAGIHSEVYNQASDDHIIKNNVFTTYKGISFGNTWTGAMIADVYNNNFSCSDDSIYEYGASSIALVNFNTSEQTGPNIIGGTDIGGNYWSDYTGFNNTDGDSFTDEPYYFNGSGVDYLPLTNTVTCTPDWSCDGYAACAINDTASCNSVTDNNACGDSYTGDYSEFAEQSCDYCTPSWECTSYAECAAQTIECLGVNDTNDCYATTGLPADDYSGDYSEFDQTCSITATEQHDETFRVLTWLVGFVLIVFVASVMLEEYMTDKNAAKKTRDSLMAVGIVIAIITILAYLIALM